MRGMPWLDEAASGGRAALADLSARRLLDGGLVEPDVWVEVGLSAALRRAAPSGDDPRLAWCTCRG